MYNRIYFDTSIKQDDVNNDMELLTPETVTLDFVKQYLRIDHDYDDLELQIALKSAISYVRKYVKQPDDEPLDFELIIPILTLTGHFYENKTPIGKSSEKTETIVNSILNLNRYDIV